jgi:flagellar hook-length control protein FliK
VQAPVHPLVGRPEFAPALGNQLTTFVREGIRQAELTLNPAEMGPVTVNIAVQGQQAQVDFVAAHAATRVALEQSLPALASALHQAGFTLTGGGVSDQRPRGQRSANQEEARAHRERLEPLGNTGPRTGAAARRGQGLLDMFA